MRRRPIMTAVALFLAAPLLGGCATLVGGGIGMLMDSGKPDYQVSSRAALIAQDQGKWVLAVGPDGRLFEGRYGGARSESDEDFAEAYARWREALSDSLKPPELHQRLTVHARTDGESVVLLGYLAGFDRDTAYIKTSKGGEGVAWESIEEWTDAGGTRCEVPVRVGSPQHAPPFLGSIRLRDGSSERLENVAWSDIRTVQLRTSRNGVKTGLLVGLAIDVAILAACAASDCFDFGSVAWQ